MVRYLIALVSLIGDFIHSINIYLPLKIFGARDVVAGILKKLGVQESMDHGQQTRNAIGCGKRRLPAEGAGSRVRLLGFFTFLLDCLLAV